MNQQQQSHTYNGWTNYQTWVVKLWIDNDQVDYNLWHAVANDIKKYRRNKELSADFVLAEQMKDTYENDNPLSDTATVWTDLMNSALAEVNWREIAKNILAELKEK